MTGVLVTGVTTPLGRAVAQALLADENGGHVLGVGFEERAPALPASSRFTYLRADLTRSRDLRSLLFGPARDLGLGAVVHTAAHRSPFSTGARAHHLNVEVSRELLHLAERHPTLRRFVYRSFAEVYRVAGQQPCLIGEEDPLDLRPGSPQWVRDRVEGDLTVCARMGLSPLHIVVLRCAELFAPDSGGQLHDYLGTRLCLRALGFDPMVNLLSIDDAVTAIRLALGCGAQGVFNIPGADTLPLSRLIALAGCRDVPLPGPLLAPLYALRRRVTGRIFNYRLAADRLHWTGVLDGGNARAKLGYQPAVPIRFG